MSNDRMRLFKSSLLLFGSFAIGFNLAIALHELSHAMAMWATGGTVERITLHPFSRSYTYYGSQPKLPMLTASAGIVFGTLFALLLLVLVSRFRHEPWFLIFIMTAIGGTANNGLYAIIDSIMLSG